MIIYHRFAPLTTQLIFIKCLTVDHMMAASWSSSVTMVNQNIMSWSCIQSTTPPYGSASTIKPRLHYTRRDATWRDATRYDATFKFCSHYARHRRAPSRGSRGFGIRSKYNYVILMDVLIQLDIVYTWLTFPQKLHPYALRNHTNTLREIRILHTGGYWLKFAEVSTRDVSTLQATWH